MANSARVSDQIFFNLRLTLRILVVTDGAINLWESPAEPARGNNDGFTLREMARVLWDAPRGSYPYTSFVVDHAIHGIGNATTRTRTEADPETGTTRTWTEYDSFRFDNPAFKLDHYDQVWLFGYWPGNPDEKGRYLTPSNRVPLNETELKILGAWMNAGGGVFATGDHELLGSHLCGNISRVNKMRRWFDLGLSNDVPSATGSDRIDTIVPVRTSAASGQPEVEFEDQSDNTPKPLHLKRYQLWDGRLHLNQPPSPFRLARSSWAPHPVLCSPLGAINILPDHMHEGLVREDNDVSLDALDSNGIQEFPGGARRPRPEVIAWATVRGGNVIYDDQGVASVTHREVPTVSVYDGEPAKLGRIVVDSTFHNWLDINVRGTGAPGQPGLTGKNLDLVHNYVRNIAQWLATPDQRDSMRNGFFLHVIANTGGWSEVSNIYRLIGEQATDVLGRVASVCTHSGLVLEPWWYEERLSNIRKDNAGKLVLPAREFVDHRVLGAMAEAVFDLMHKLPRNTGPDDYVPECDSIKEFQLINARLGAARRAGAHAMTAEWRESLKLTVHFLDALGQALDDDDSYRSSS